MDRAGRLGRAGLVSDAGSLATLASVDGHRRARRSQRRSGRPRLGNALALSPMAFIGTVSYGMYLLNSLCIHFVHAVLGSIGVQYPPVIFPIGLTVTVVSPTSAIVIRNPILALKTRFSRLNTAAAKPSIPASAPAAPSESAQPS